MSTDELPRVWFECRPSSPGSIQGVARDDSGAPLPHVTVVLLPDESRRNRIDLNQSTVSDAAGRYRFDRVPPGNYRLFAWEDVEKEEWRNPTFMRFHENRGKDIVIGEKTSSNEDLSVIRIR